MLASDINGMKLKVAKAEALLSNLQNLRTQRSGIQDAKGFMTYRGNSGSYLEPLHGLDLNTHIRSNFELSGLIEQLRASLLRELDTEITKVQREFEEL